MRQQALVSVDELEPLLGCQSSVPWSTVEFEELSFELPCLLVSGMPR